MFILLHIHVVEKRLRHRISGIIFSLKFVMQKEVAVIEKQNGHHLMPTESGYHRQLYFHIHSYMNKVFNLFNLR